MLSQNKSITKADQQKVIELLINTLSTIKKLILETNFDSEFFTLFSSGPNNYSTIVETTDSQGNIKKQINKRDFPQTVYNIVQCIDQAIAGKETPYKVFTEIYKLIIERTGKSISKKYFNLLNEIFSKNMKSVAKEILASIQDMLEKTIDDLKQKNKTPSLSNTQHDDLIKKLDGLNTLKNKVEAALKDRNLYMEKTPKLIEEFIALDVEYKLGINQKLLNFYQKKIQPFLPYLQANIQNDELINDLNLIIENVINENYQGIQDNVFQLINNEIVVKVNQSYYSLTNIFLHEPHFLSLKISANILDKHLEFLKHKACVALPVNFPVPNWKNLSSSEIMAELDDVLKQKPGKNDFEKCHATHCLLSAVYTTPAYVIINKILRTGTLSRDVFQNLPNDPLVKSALLDLENNLRRQNTGAELNDDEMNKVIYEFFLAGVFVTIGLLSVKQATYDPTLPPQVDDTMLSSDRALTLRGSSGSWIPKRKKDLAMANEVGMGVYLEGITSTSWCGKAIEPFKNSTSNPTNSMVMKVLAFSTDNNTSIGAACIAPLSMFPTEFEGLYPHGVLMLPAGKETQVKHKQHYGNIDIDNKYTIVITDGKSLNIQFYSSELNKRHTELLTLSKICKNITASNPQAAIILENMQSSLLLLANQLTTLRKQIAIVMMNGTPGMTDIEPLCGEASGAYVFINQGIYFVDKENKMITNFPTISPSDFAKMVEILDLSFPQLPAQGHQCAVPFISLLQATYIQKLAQHIFINIDTLAEKLTKSNPAWLEIKADYDQLPLVDQQAINSQSQGTYHSFVVQPQPILGMQPNI